MKNIKITITDNDKIVIIPIAYDEEKDSMTINELQVEPVPDENEDISKDLVFVISRMILEKLTGI